MDVFERADEEVCLCLWRIDVDTVWCIKCSLTQHLCEEMFALFFTNECLWWSCLFSNLPTRRRKGRKRYKKRQISGFYELCKKEEVLTRREGDEKKEKISKSKQTCQKFPPSFLGERECACVRVCDRDAATTKNPAVADDPK